MGAVACVREGEEAEGGLVVGETDAGVHAWWGGGRGGKVTDCALSGRDGAGKINVFITYQWPAASRGPFPAISDD